MSMLSRVDARPYAGEFHKALRRRVAAGGCCVPDPLRCCQISEVLSMALHLNAGGLVSEMV